MSMGTLLKQSTRTVKNYTKGYSSTQSKVREATSNDPWGPSGAILNEIAALSYNQADFVEIMEMLDKRLNDRGRNWRHVYKSLTVVDYLLGAGSSNVVAYFRRNTYLIKTLAEFQYIDEDMNDQGANVRSKAKDISNLLADPDRLADERRGKSAMRSRMSRDDRDRPRRESSYDDNENDQDGGGGNYYDSDRRKNTPSRSTPQRTRTADEDAQYKQALAASKASAEAAESASRASRAKEDDDMAKAIALSRAEDERKQRELNEANARALFDEQNTGQTSASAMYMSNAYTGAQQLDFFGNPLQPSYTGFNTQQPQHTGFAGHLQQQQTGYNSNTAAMYQQQQQQQLLLEQQQQEAARLQAEYQSMLLQQQQQQQLQLQQQQQWLQQQQQQQQQQMLRQQQQALQAQQTGFKSNNPFALPSSSSSDPNGPLSAPAMPKPEISSQPVSQPKTYVTKSSNSNNNNDSSNGQFQKLNDLLAAGEGVDTFGNVGMLRIPAGSAFHASNRVAGQNAIAAKSEQMKNQQTGAGSHSSFY